MGAVQRIGGQVAADAASSRRRGVENGDERLEREIVNDAPHDLAVGRQFADGELGSIRSAIEESDSSGPGIPADQVYAELRALIATYQPTR